VTRRGTARVEGYALLAALLLLGQAVAVDTREGLDQRCLAVVDVPGGAHDDRHAVLLL